MYVGKWVWGAEHVAQLAQVEGHEQTRLISSSRLFRRKVNDFETVRKI